MVNSKCFILIEGTIVSLLVFIFILFFSFPIFTFTHFYIGPHFHQNVCYVSESINFVFNVKSFWFDFFLLITACSLIGKSGCVIITTVADGTANIPSNTWIMMIINKIWRGIFTDAGKIWLIVCYFSSSISYQLSRKCV